MPFELFNDTIIFETSTILESTEWQTTGSDEMEYTDISGNPGTEAILALISCSIAVLILFLYIRDLVASGVCIKGFRHMIEDSPTNNEQYFIPSKVPTKDD